MNEGRSGSQAATDDISAEERRFHGNRPPAKGDDRFGFRPFASLVARAALNASSGDCLVVGLEGEWGSGKSTLLSMLEEELDGRKASVARFAPWLIGSRDALLEELIAVLDKAVAEQRSEQGDTTGETVIAARSGLAQFRRYSTGVAALGRLVGAAGQVGLPAGVLVGDIIGKLSETMKEGVAETTIERAKSRTADALKALDERIVVLIDDLDRLEPREAVEVLRLVQAVADFPNVTYVLSYDRGRLADGVRTVLNIPDGAAYLEKLIQVVVPLPQAQPPALQDMFTRELKAITGLEDLSRLADLIVDHIGPRIRTPRGVIRILDSMRLLWPVLGKRVDVVDLVWLQMVRAEDHRLYRWIDGYVAEASQGRSEEQNAVARSRLAKDLEIRLNEAAPLGPDWKELRSRLPMIASGNGKPAEVLLMPPDDKRVFATLNHRRLSSIEHARIYFALLPPEGITAQGEYEGLMLDGADAELVADRLLRLAKVRSVSGPALIELVLNLVSASLPQLSPEKLKAVSKALMTTVDDVVRVAPVADRNVFWRVISDFIDRLVDLQGPEAWAAVLDETLQDNVALDLLTRELGTKSSGHSDWIRSDPHTAAVRAHLAANYAARDDQWLAQWVPNSNVVASWKIADPEALRSFLNRVIADDALFRTWVVRRYEHLVQRQGDMKVFGRAAFANEMEELWGATRVVDRLAELAGSDEAQAAEIRGAIDVIREELASKESSGDQNDGS